MLADEATKLMLGSGARRRDLRLCLRRAFIHAQMKDAAKGFAAGKVSDRIRPGLAGQPIQWELRNVASAFIDLQQARHDADYNLIRSFTRAETFDLLDQAQQAFDDWSVVRGSIQADTFLISLLVIKALRG